MSNQLPAENVWKKIFDRFKMGDGLTIIKLFEYLPSMIVTNLSTLLLITVDGLVVGNLVGKEALSAVNIFQPATAFIGAISVLVANGATTSLSVSMGKNDMDGIRRAKSAVIRLMIIAAVAVAFLQIPIVYLIISSYKLSPQMQNMTWSYAIGVMLSMPLGLISTVGVYQLQIVGRMKILMKLAALEGLVNLALDLLLVGVFHMGVAGAGFGTACANLVRCSATVLYLMKKTDIYKTGGVKAKIEDIRNVFKYGFPEAANSATNALQNYLIMMIILFVFGPDGGVIKGVCVFCTSLINVFFSGVNGSMRPLLGLMTGARDLEGLKKLILQCFILIETFAIAMVALIMLAPEWFYHIHGVAAIPDGGIVSLRFFSLQFLFVGVNTMMRTYFINRGESNFATKIGVSSTFILLVVMFILCLLIPGPYIWLAYLITEILVFNASYAKYLIQMKQDKADSDPNAGILYLTVSPEDAAEASEMIQNYADEIGCPKALAYKVALCMEEMVAYAVKERTGEDIDIKHLNEGTVYKTDKSFASKIKDTVKNWLTDNPDLDLNKIQIHIMIRLTPEEAEFMMIDDGKRIVFDENEESQKAATDNYTFLKRIAKSVDYQYVIDMNYTVVKLG